MNAFRYLPDRKHENILRMKFIPVVSGLVVAVAAAVAGMVD